MLKTFEFLVKTSVGPTKAHVEAEASFQAKALAEQKYGAENILSAPMEKR